MKGKCLDLVGMRFGKLTVVALDPVRTSAGSTRWQCVCDCGEHTTVRVGHLRGGGVRSCGCLKSALKHGHSGLRQSPEYNSWCAMKARCMSPNHAQYKDYGGRGIRICERWLHSFESFLADMGERPAGHTLHRLDNDGPYAPENCRWATWEEQNNHRRPPCRTRWSAAA